MIPIATIDGLRAKFSQLHPLIFHRSVERSETAGMLFDVLESMPNEYPIVWNETGKRWDKTLDLLQSEKLS